uniref:Uncharacterized protein n=1 Tax=Vespula pensylvanica TaxID=30213 RepID=A0A834KXJ0_VESPE|nr:hypothetical protein H0235_012815 [Vespula pensylvanica]
MLVRYVRFDFSQPLAEGLRDYRVAVGALMLGFPWQYSNPMARPFVNLSRLIFSFRDHLLQGVESSHTTCPIRSFNSCWTVESRLAR